MIHAFLALQPLQNNETRYNERELHVLSCVINIYELNCTNFSSTNHHMELITVTHHNSLLSLSVL